MTMNNDMFDARLRQLKQQLGLDNLDSRERLVLAGGAILVLCVVVYQFLVSPYLVAHDRLEKSLVRKRAELAELKLLSAEYASLRAEEGGVRQMLLQREKGFTLFAFLDRQADRTGVKEKIKYMKPSFVRGESGLNESVVEMGFEGVTLDKLTEFLQLTESEESVVSVRRLSIQASSREEGVLDVVLQIVTLVEAG